MGEASPGGTRLVTAHNQIKCAFRDNTNSSRNLPQACTADGTVYDIVNIVTYIQKFKRHPVSGESLALKNVISLNFAKNGEGQYHCPVLHKVGFAVPFQTHEMHGRRQARPAALVVKDAGTGSRGADIEGRV